MTKSFASAFSADLKSNNARWHHRAFWFSLFLRGVQHTKGPLRVLCKAAKKLVLAGTCCELPASSFEGGVYFPHFNGIVISPYAHIGSDVKILQQVTIGVDFE